MHFFVTAPTLHWLGPTAAALRLPWAWLGILTVPVTFWLVKKLGGLYLALLATLLLALYHFHIHYSRLNLDNIADPLIGALAFLFFYRARSRESPMDWGWLGATWGAGMYLYQGARLIPFLVFGVACYVTLFERDRAREYLRGFGIALGAFLIVAAPMLQYALGNPGIFNGREDTVGILQNGWIDREAQVTGKGVVQILFDQFRYALFAFNLYPDASGFYGLEQPLLDPIFGVFFLLGLGYGTIRVITPNPDRRLAPMVAWWWCGMIFGGMLTLAPPSSHRLITLAVPVCFFIALGVVQVIGLARKAVTGLPSAALCAASIALFGTISLYTYFVDYAPRHLAGGGGAEVSTELGLTLQKDLDWQRIYFFGAPYIFWDFPTLSFLLPGADAVDLIDPIQIPPPANWLAPNKATLFIFLPGRIAEMTLVQKTFPHGKIQELWTPRDGSVIATIYKVPPSEK
jgi:4-amino-4-deoxy-L-arabinose transferase-like glycosyltransferase